MRRYLMHEKVFIKIIFIVLSVFTTEVNAANNIEAFVENKSIDNNNYDRLDTAVKYAIAADSTGKILFQQSNKIMKFLLSKNLKNLGKNVQAYNLLRSDYLNMYRKMMFGTLDNEGSLAAMLQVLDKNLDQLDKVDNLMKHNLLSAKKFTSIRKTILNSTAAKSYGKFSKGLGALGVLSSLYGVYGDLTNNDGLALKSSKFVYNSYGVIDAGLGILGMYGIEIGPSALTGAFVGGMNMTFGIMALGSAHFTGLLSENNQMSLNLYLKEFTKQEETANHNIEYLIEITYENIRNKSYDFNRFFDSDNLLLSEAEKKELKKQYLNSLSNSASLKTLVNEDNLAALTQSDCSYIISSAMDNIYMEKSNAIIEKVKKITDQYKDFAVRYAAFWSAGAIYHIYDSAYNLLDVMYSMRPVLSQSRKVAYASLSTQYAIAYAMEQAKILYDANKQIAQKKYDDANTENKSYRTKVYNLSGLKYMVSFDYDADDRIDKCVDKSKFYSGVNYLLGKDFTSIVDQSAEYLDFIPSYEISTEKITIKDALKLLDMYSNELLNEIGYGDRYKNFSINPKGKLNLKFIYKSVWYKKFNDLGLEGYIKRQYTQMQAGNIDNLNDEMHHLDKCLTGYKAVDFIKAYRDTLWWYLRKSQEGN